MSDEKHRNGSKDNSSKLKLIVIGLAVAYVLTFLGGFLQDTQLNFINYIFFALLFAGGIVLARETVKSGEGRITKGVLFLTGISTALLFSFYIGYEFLRLNGYKQAEASIEALLYLLTLVFWVSVIASIVLIRKRRGRAYPQS